VWQAALVSPADIGRDLDQLGIAVREAILAAVRMDFLD